MEISTRKNHQCIKRFATFLEDKIVLVRNSDKSIDYLIIDYVEIEDPKKIASFMKKIFIEKSKEFKKVLGFHNEKVLGKLFNKKVVGDIFGAIYETQNILEEKGGHEIYESIINLNSDDWFSKYDGREVQEAKMEILNSILNHSPSRVYENGMRVIAGIRPTFIDDVNEKYIKNSLIEKIENHLNVINEFLKKSDFKFEIFIREYKKNDEVFKYMSLKNTSGRLIDINEAGDGIRQILPILEAILLSKGVFTAIREPEVHMHPKSNAELGSFIAKESKKILIETHSNEIIERIRFEKSAGNSKVVILNTFFYDDKGIKNNEVSFVKDDGRFDKAVKYLEFIEDETLKWFR